MCFVCSPPAVLGPPSPQPRVSPRRDAGGSQGTGSQASPARGPALLPTEAALVLLWPQVYVCKRRAGALAAPGDKFRGTNPFPGFPEQTNELKGEQHHSTLEEPPKTTFQLF